MPMRALFLVFLCLPARQDEPSAADLLKDVGERIGRARTLRVESTISLSMGGQVMPWVTTAVRMKGNGKWKVEYRVGAARGRGGDFGLLSDGRKVVSLNAQGPAPSVKPEEYAAEIRRGLATVAFDPLTLLSGNESKPPVAPEIGAVKDGGKDKVGGKEVRIAEFTIKPAESRFGRQECTVRSFIDAADRRILRKEVAFQGTSFVEEYTAFALDEEMPDSDFSCQTREALARARAGQAARSADLFTAFTGRPPAAFSDLARRPADLDPDIFWPEGGFLLGGSTPADFKLPKAGAQAIATRRAVGGAPERLQKVYTARIRLHLLAAAIRAFRECYQEFPAEPKDLWERPPWAEVWPEGGWIDGSRLPDDPWGMPLRLLLRPRVVRVQVQDARSHDVTATPDEARALEAASRPRVTDDERRRIARLLDRLCDDDLETREAAKPDLAAWGPAIVPFVEERMKSEADAEAARRFKAILGSIRVPRPAWSAELSSLILPVLPGPVGDENLENLCTNNLGQLWKMQHIYMSRFGGRMKSMPKEAGSRFWLVLNDARIQLIDDSMLEIFICPASGEEPAKGTCSYAGPAQDVSKAGDGDPVGLCEDEGHGDVVIILRKSGAVEALPRGGPDHQDARKKTKR